MSMKHVLPSLPFAKDALQPVLCAEAVELHHDRHHAAYVKKLNELIAGTEYEDLTLEEIVLKAPRGQPLFNNAAQAWNHDFLWKSLTPPSSSSEDLGGGELERRITADFGSVADFRTKFEEIATQVFGSGWAWLVLDARTGKLNIEQTSNAETPIVTTGSAPLLACDVWEHAYYVDYRNERPKYLKSLWKVTNWKFAESNLTLWTERKGQAA